MAIGYSSFVTPTGNLVPVLSGPSFSVSFSNTAVFTNSSGSDCSAGAYRQYVMGAFYANGSQIMHVLCGSTFMSPTVYLEDGCPSPGCTAFGYRACPASPHSQYFLPDQATGSNYVMQDAPGFRNVTPGMTYRIALSFQGRLIDTSTNATLVSQIWTVNGLTTVPEQLSAAAAVGMTADDRVLAVQSTHNHDSGRPEVHVIVKRAPGNPPLSPTAVPLLLHDARGGVVTTGRPVTHEVGGLRHSTATIVYPLEQSARTPVRATVDGANLTLDILER